MKFLEGDYDRTCKNYDLDDQGGIKMRTDCILDCIMKHYGDNCTYHVIKGSMYLMRKRQLPRESTKYNCRMLTELILTDFDQVQLKCQLQCKGECYQAQYLYETKFISNKLVQPSYNRDKPVRINLIRNGLPDVSIDYMPEMTFISLVCNFGGLVGMWCGISVLACMKNMVAFIKYTFNKIIFKINNHNLIFNNNNSNLFVKILKPKRLFRPR